MRKCNEPGCTYNVFGGSKCKYHQFRRHMKGGDLYKPKPRKSTPINKESPKRKKENKRYLEVLKEFWDQSVADKTDFCFFCGVHMTKRDNIHHLLGREGDKLLDTEWWVNAHNDCHVFKYHYGSYDQLIKLPWYSGFLERLKNKCPQAYYKELKKADKNLEISF